jgi:hypothetical protein
MLTPAGPVTPGYVVRRTGQTRRVARPSSTRPSRPADPDEVSVLLNCQWPGPSQAQRAGWPALARALVAEACLDAGLARRRGPVRQRDRWSAARYLLEADEPVPLPLETACLLADLDPVRVRATVRLRLP